MIGHKHLIEKINNLKYLPLSILLVGNKGCEQEEILNYISNKFNLQLVMIDDVSVDNIRKMIQMSYNTNLGILYAIPNADDMSISAKNSILKIMEEPPNNSHFVLLLEDENNTLYTINSRSVTYHLDNYTPSQIIKYYQQKDCYSKEFEMVVGSICKNIGDVDILCRYDIKEFTDYVDTVVTNIDVVSGSNCFKIADKIALKGEEDKYDLRLFWNTFIDFCQDYMWNNPEKYCAGVFATSNALKQLRNKSINKQMLFDEWILNVRAEWRLID